MSSFNLSALAVRERAVTLFFLLLSILAGLYAFISLGRAEDPNFTVRVMQVNVAWPGATVQQLQEQVVDRLEKRIQEVEFIYRVESTITPGQATLQVEFHDYTPQARVRELFYEVRKRMWDEASQMPRGVIGPFANDDFSDVYFSLLALVAPGMPTSELARQADRLRDELQRIEGVHKALLIGERSERIFVEFDHARLVNLGLSPQALFAIIDASNKLLPSGRLETEGPRLYLRLDADLSDPQTLAELPIRAGDAIFRLGDIATIRRGYEDPPSYLVRASGKDAVLIGLVMQAGANGLTLGQKLASYLERKKTELPLGMELMQLTNQADAIHNAVNLFQIKFLVAVAVVIGVSMLAMGLRAGVIVGMAIPVTLGIGFLLMKLLGINLDRITLGALIISLGLLVDDAIIAVEMMLVKIEEGWDRLRAAAHAWNVTAAPMLFGTLVTVAGFLPIGFARSAVGEYAGNIFWVLAIMLGVSWLVAVIFTPYLGVKLLPSPATIPGHEQHDIMPPLRHRRLRALVSWCVVHRKTVVFATLAALLLAIFGMVNGVQKQFFPSSNRPEVLISVYLPQGTSIAVTDRVVQRLEERLSTMPEVKTLSAYVGGGAPRFFISANPEPPNPAFAKIIVVAHDQAGRERIIATLEQAIAAGQFAEARVRVSRLLYGPPVAWPLQFRVFGPDPNQLRAIAHQVRDVMSSDPHAVDPHLEWDERTPVLYWHMEPQRLRRLNLTPQEVAEQLQFLLDGVAVTELRRDTRSVQLIARGASAGQKLDVQALSRLEISNRDGHKLPLEQLGTLEVRYDEPIIKRYNREPFLSVQAEVRGAQANDVTQALWQALAPIRAHLPPGYRIEIGGSSEQSQKAEGSIQKLQPVMVAFMLMFIMLQMRSFLGTFMVVATAPLGLIGAVLALLLFKQPFGFVALLGLIGLAGILMRNTLILTQQVSENLKASMPPMTAIIEAAVRRARPVMLTALAAILAFVPLTQDSFWGPLAYLLIGGLAVGTVITLLFVPALYALWFRVRPQA